MEFNPVWVSSLEHLEQFESILRASSLVERGTTHYRMPDTFPYLRGPHGILRTPITMFASGRLTVDAGVLAFESQREKPLFSRYRNLRSGWKWSLSAGEILRVEDYEYVSPVLEYYNLPWTRVTSARSEDGDLLLCAGAKGPKMDKLREKNRVMLRVIQEAFPESSHPGGESV